jgi:hypothetical protein
MPALLNKTSSLAARLSRECVECRDQLSAIGDVERAEEALARREVLAQHLERVGVAVAGADEPAAARVELRGGAADARGGARDEDGSLAFSVGVIHSLFLQP